jgi:hypothetical protein
LYLDDAPKLRRRVLMNAGGAVPGRKTYWQWQGVADAAPIAVTGTDGAVVIEGEGPEPVRVVITKRGLICPFCSGGAYLLVWANGGFRCRSCCNLKYRSRTWPHPMYTRRSILYRLARSDPGSLRERKLQAKLEKLNAMTEEQASRVGTRCTYPGRQRRGIA